MEVERHSANRFRAFHNVLEPIPAFRCLILIHRANGYIKGGAVIYVRKSLTDGKRMFYQGHYFLYINTAIECGLPYLGYTARNGDGAEACAAIEC